MARPPATRALQLLLALSWILRGQSNLTSLPFLQMTKNPLNSIENQELVTTGDFLIKPQTVITKSLDNQMSWILTLSEKCKLELQSPLIVIVVPVLYSVAFLVGLPVNILALWVLIFHTEKIPSTILLINLTVLDVLLLLMLPFRIIYYFAGNDWFFGEPMCRLVMALLYGSMCGSVLTLALISIDRYTALVHPYSALTLRSHCTSLAMSVSVWVVVLLSMLLVLPFRQSYQLTNLPIITCYDVQSDFIMTLLFPYYISFYCICFLLPLLVIVFCHGAILKTLLARGQSYSHAACLTALILLGVLACFLPGHILLLLLLTDQMDNLYVPYIVSLAVSYFSPCIDPFIYNYVSDDFRGKVLRVLCCCHARQQVSPNNCDIHLSSSSQSRSTLLSKFLGQMKMCQDL
ncbi:proteinase-activated receptor 4-like [Brienomyrus brachyistius]|uniref:proteinase-activated receptor 4-like n=1 Tax=Brienomyrus brachyistius TaxID=42636 RepID=UPI0020B30462|nr:proteinase-activated receptor 4-like [Brienomyrus brachyistius]